MLRECPSTLVTGGSRPRHRREMGTVVRAPVRRRGAGPVLDEHVLTVLPGVPGPAEIADAVTIGPGQERVVKADGGAHVVAGLSDEHGDLQRDGPDYGVP